MRLMNTASILTILAVAVGTPAIAAKGGNGGGGNGNGNGNGAGRVAQSASCAVSETTVSATGLPTGEVVNFMFSDPSGSWGWVLGYTDDGTWTVSVPARTGPTTYEFVSRTWGPDGSRYRVFASCSA